MDVLLTEEEELLRKGAREFLEAEVPPGLVRAMEKDDLGYPPELWKKMADMGWLGLALPEKYGGQGLPLTYLGLLVQEMGRVLAPVPFHGTMVTALTIARDGTEEQRQEVLPRVARGEMALTWALIESTPRFFHPEDVHLQAVARGDRYEVTGTKMFVENFGAAEKCLVACRTAPATSGNHGISLFLVDTKQPGVSATPLVTLARDKQSQVTFTRVAVPKKNLVGGLHQGWPVVEAMLDRGAALLCSQLLGASRRQAEMAIAYSKERYAFGQPLGGFQSIAHTCADMIIWVDGGELLTYEAMWRLDQGLPASIEVSQAKAFCNDKCMPLGRLANAVHGGMGFMEEFDLTLWFRRIEAMTLKLGSSFEHRARIANALLDRPGQVQLGEDLYSFAPSS